MFDVMFKGKSLNADRAATLKSFDKSEVGMLRVITNEIIHTINTGDFRGLKTVLMHVENRAAVFSVVRSIVRAVAGDAIKVALAEEGLTITLAKGDKRTFTEHMGTLVQHRDEAIKGIFNEVLLASLGIEKAATPAYDLAKAVEAFSKRAKKEGITMDDVVAALKGALAKVYEVVAEPVEGDEAAPAFDEELKAVG